MATAPSGVVAEILRIDAPFGQKARRGRAAQDRAIWRQSIGGDAISQHGQRPHAVDDILSVLQSLASIERRGRDESTAGRPRKLFSVGLSDCQPAGVPLWRKVISLAVTVGGHTRDERCNLCI